MITVSIAINRQELHAVHAVNCSEANGLEYGKGRQQYSVHDTTGRYIKNVFHNFEDGAIVLSRLLLDVLEEENNNG